MNWRRFYLHSNSTNQTHNQLSSHSSSSYILVSKRPPFYELSYTVQWLLSVLSFLVLLQSVLRRYVYIRIAFLSSEPTSLQVNDILVSYVVMNIIYEFILFFFKQFVVLYKVCVFRVLLIFLQCIDINTTSIMYTDHHSS